MFVCARRVVATSTSRLPTVYRFLSGIPEPIIIHSKGTYSGSAADPSDSLEKEKELFALKRAIAQAYNKGHYADALARAVEMQGKAEDLYGKNNPVYASCLNNTALMVSDAY